MNAMDDAGTMFTPVSIGELAKDPRITDPRFALVIERTIRAQLMHRRHVTPIVVTLSVLLPLSGVGGLLLGVPLWVLMPLVMAIPIGLVAAGRRVLRSRSMPQVVSVLIRHGVCACCGYDLSREPADGPLVRCPECGCEWDGTRVKPRSSGGVYLWGDEDAVRRARRRFTWGPMSFGPTRAIDARGRVVPLVSSRLRAQVAAAPESPYKLRLLDARAEFRYAGLWKRLAVGLVLCGLGVAQLMMFVLSPRGALGALNTTLLSAVFVYFGIQFARGSFGTPRRILISSLLRRQLCPTCAADLASSLSMNTQADREVECPDCGAIWRPEVTLTSHPPVA